MAEIADWKLDIRRWDAGWGVRWWEAGNPDGFAKSFETEGEARRYAERLKLFMPWNNVMSIEVFPHTEINRVYANG